MAASLTRAMDRLREAVEVLPPVGEERDPSRSGDTAWQVMCRQCLRGWVEAVGRDLVVAAGALRSAARTRSSWDLRERRLEEAVWRLVSARDRLAAVAALSLGTPVLKRQGGSVRFWPEGKKLQKRIEALAAATQPAAELLDLWKAIENHEAVDMRNTITHKVPSVTDIPPLVFLEDVFCISGRPVRYDHPYLVGRKIGSTLEPDVLLDEGRHSARELLGLLVAATVAVAGVLAEAGALHPPRVCTFECSPGLRDCRLVKVD